MKKKILLIVVCALVASCTHISEKPGVDRVLIFSSNDRSLSGYVDSVSFLPLETERDYIFRNIDKMVFRNGNIYIGDYHSRKILVYNKDGKGVFTLDRTGRGPGEYLDMKSFTVDGKYIYILDNQMRKVHRYEASAGSFVDSFDLSFVAWDMEVLYNGGFIFAFAPMAGGRLDKSQPPYRILITDNDMKITGKMFEYGKGDYDLIGYPRYFSAYKDEIIYSSYAFDGYVIFDRNTGMAKETVGIVFNHGIPEKSRQDPAVLSSSYTYLISAPVCCNGYVMTEISNGNYIENFMYDSSKAAFVGNAEDDGKSIICSPISCVNGCFVSLVSDIWMYNGLMDAGLDRASLEIEQKMGKGCPVLLFYHMKN